MPFINEFLDKILPYQYQNDDVQTVNKQHDWMIQTWEPACNGKVGRWEDYWSISTWTTCRRQAKTKAALEIRRQSHIKRKWRLKYLRARDIPPTRINHLDGRCL